MFAKLGTYNNNGNVMSAGLYRDNLATNLCLFDCVWNSCLGLGMVPPALPCLPCLPCPSPGGNAAPCSGPAFRARSKTRSRVGREPAVEPACLLPPAPGPSPAPAPPSAPVADAASAGGDPGTQPTAPQSSPCSVLLLQRTDRARALGPRFLSAARPCSAARGFRGPAWSSQPRQPGGPGWASRPRHCRPWRSCAGPCSCRGHGRPR